MKVYFSGRIAGSYRAQNIIKTFSDARIAYSYIDYAFLSFKSSKRYLRKLITLLLTSLTAPIRIFLIARSSHIFVLPMNKSVIVLAEIFLGKLLNKKIIVDYYISHYDALVNDQKSVSKKSITAKKILFLDRGFMKASDIVIFLNEAESEYYQKVAGLKLTSEKIKIIPLCIDYKRELFVNERKATENFNVCWWGTYIPLHGLENLIKAFEHIKNHNINLYLFGDSDEKAAPYLALIESLGLSEKIKINNKFRFANGLLAPFLAQQCHLAIGNFGDSDKAKTVLVNKLVDALSLGIPCLTMKTRATSELLANNEGLIIVDPVPEAIAREIQRAASDLAALKEIGQTGKAKYLELFSPDSFKIKILGLLQQC